MEEIGVSARPRHQRRQAHTGQQRGAAVKAESVKAGSGMTFQTWTPAIRLFGSPDPGDAEPVKWTHVMAFRSKHVRQTRPIGPATFPARPHDNFCTSTARSSLPELVSSGNRATTREALLP